MTVQFLINEVPMDKRDDAQMRTDDMMPEEKRDDMTEMTDRDSMQDNDTM